MNNNPPIEYPGKGTGPHWITGEYERLYDQLKADTKNRVVCFVDYYWHGQLKNDTPFRDICTVNFKTLEFVSRGHGYGGADSWLYGETKRKSFKEDCSRLNVQWLDESAIAKAQPLSKDIIDFIRDVATNWDCDKDSHTYNMPCRKCEAIKLLKEMGEEISDWAKSVQND